MKNVSQAAARVYAQALFDIGLETGTVGEIYDDLHAAYNALNGLDADLLNALRLAIEQRTKKSVDLTETIDPEVIGGLRVNVGDRVLDGTLRRSLQDMRRNFAATQSQG